MNSKMAESLQLSLGVDLVAFAPQLVLCGAIVLLLLIRLVPRYDRLHLGWIALVLVAFICYLSCALWFAPIDPIRSSNGMFGNMLIYDHFSIFLNIFLYAFVTL